MQTHPAFSLSEHFKSLPDPRVDRTKLHLLHDILILAITAMLCGAESFEDMEDFGLAKEEWFKTFLDLPHGIPSHDTFNRLFSALDPQAFLECFMAWTQSVRVAVGEEIVAMDGKALRRACGKTQTPRCVVSAWAATNGLVLGQQKVADKSNEITAVPELLRALELAGCIVTLDAMGCQKNIAKEIIEADAHYVLALKGNQGITHQEVKSFLDDAAARKSLRLAHHQTVEKDHGRIETRRYWHTDDLAWFMDRDQWEGLRSVGMVEAVREVDGQQSVERRYYLSSLPIDAVRFARAVRSHWAIENQLHWVLDVSFGEDQSRARTGHAAENLATLRRLALNLLKKDTTKRRGIRGKQKNAGWNHAYLLHLLGL